MKRAICIISGGMDSTTCAYIAKNEGYDIIGLHFDYNQRTKNKEKECFLKTCEALDIKDKFIVDTNFLATFGGNSLTDRNLEIQKSGIKKGEIPNTFVPFRNGLFLSIAASLAEVKKADAIFIGVVEEDSSGYPDCKIEFINSMQKSINIGLARKDIKILTPLINLSKADIVKKALSEGVRLIDTWSCYEREDLACGLCDSCRLRLNGFKEAKEIDPIKYL